MRVRPVVQPARDRGLRGLALFLLLASCVQLQVKVPPPLPPEPPMPAPFAGEESPALVPTPIPGILAAPAVDPNLYYAEAEQLWYRWHRKQWYQAFRWNGHWFPPEDVPGPLRAGPPEPSPQPD